MRMNPRAARRMLLIGAVLVLVVAVLVSVFVVRTWQVKRRAVSQRAQGLAHFQNHEYGSTLDKLGPYLRVQAHQTDREALIVYGKAREAIEETNLRHLREAIVVYRSAFELDPTDRETGLTLLKHYNAIGFGPEARDLAVRLRPASLAETTARDLEALRGEVSARITLRAYDAQLDRVLERILSLAPDDFGAHLTWISVLRETGRGAAAIDHTRHIVEAHPADVRFQFLQAVARVDDATPGATGADEFFRKLCELTGLDPQTAEQRTAVSYTDTIFIARLLGSFDALSRSSHSLGLLREASARLADADLTRAFVRRAWQAGRYREVADRLETLDLSPSGAHTELLAFKALSLTSLGSALEARAIADALARRGDDFRARAWASALGHVADPTVAGRVSAIAALSTAQREDPLEPTFSFLLGEALFTLDRTEEAREQWQAVIASPLARGWATPHSRIAATLLGQGRFEEALKAAQQGQQTAQGNPASSVSVLSAKLAIIEAGRRPPEDPKAMLDQVERGVAQLDVLTDQEAARAVREVLIPGRVLLRSYLGDRKGAAAAISQELNRVPASAPNVLARLALISARFGLGREQECLDLAQRGNPQDAALALTRAMVFHAAGKDSEGLRTLAAGTERADEEHRTEWQIATARYLDVSDAGKTALASWVRLADANPEDFRVQLAALASRSAPDNLDFIERVAQRVARLSGTDPLRPTITGRLARARGLLAATTTSARRDEAVSLLRSMISEAPGLVEPRRLLARALLLDVPSLGIKPDVPAALEQLRGVALAAPGEAEISIEMARLYQRQRDPVRAAEEIKRLLDDPATPMDAREQAIALLIAQRDYAAARGPLESMISGAGAGATHSSLLQLAAVYRGLGQSKDALAVYHRLAAMPSQEGRHAFELADGLAACGDSDGATSVLAGLDSFGLAPGVAESARGRFTARYGDPAVASTLLERAAELDPKSFASWRDLAAFYTARRDFAKAQSAVERAAVHLPESADLAVLREQVVTVAAGENASLTGLINALSKVPGNVEQVAAMRAVEAARAGGRLGDAKALAELSSRFPTDPGVQSVVLRAYLSMTPPRADLASELAQRAIAACPESPGLSRLAFASFRTAQDWPRMLAAATAWDRGSGSVEAQMAVAEAELRNGHAARAIGTIRPLIDSARTRPEDPASAAILDVFARALIETNRESDAFELLSPTLAGPGMMRAQVWPALIASALQTGSAAEKWAGRAIQAAGKDDRAALIAVAGACADAAQRLPDRKQELLELAKSVLTPIAADPTAGATIHERLGLALQLLGDTVAAEVSYRRAIKLDQTSSIAIGNLTDLAIERGSEIDEAIVIARKAVESPNTPNPTLLFSLAKLQSAKADQTSKGDAAAAREWLARSLRSYEAAMAQMPAQFELSLRASEVHARLGNHLSAFELLDRTLQSPSLSPETRALAQNNAAFELLRLNRSAADLTRARELAASAVKQREHPAYLDTLGQIELALGQKAPAQAAFRRAIALDQRLASPLLGLAASLDETIPAQKQEASALLSRAEALWKDRPEEYSAADEAAVKALKARLAQVN